MTSYSVTSFFVTSYRGLRSRCEKLKNYNVNFGHYVENDWVDENNRYNRMW